MSLCAVVVRPREPRVVMIWTENPRRSAALIGDSFCR
nr:MAG TPA: hypothetical protein [Caudoviricetes sp.]